MALSRTPRTVPDHEWWRLLTPMFVHSDGWTQILFNFTSIAIVGAIVEKLYGYQRWLILYFVPGSIGELCGLAWQPYGAGASVAGSGLLGGLGARLLRHESVPGRLRGVCISLLAIAPTIRRDIHGPPILAGLCIGFVMLWQSLRS